MNVYVHTYLYKHTITITKKQVMNLKESMVERHMKGLEGRKRREKCIYSTILKEKEKKIRDL